MYKLIDNITSNLYIFISIYILLRNLLSDWA
jgi:hypothetical protein